MLISDVIKDSLVLQLEMEKSNANLYLSIASFLRKKGLNNFAKHFEGQHDEEQKHSLIIYDLLVNLGESFSITKVESPAYDFSSMSEIGNLYLEKEIQTTKSLNDIKSLASMSDEAGCSVVEARMIKMIKMQEAEFAEATDFYDKFEIIGDDWKTALIVDSSLTVS